MKKITILMMGLCSIASFAQQKTTGVIAASTNVTASLTLDNDTQDVILSLTGPNDRWFALQFGSFDGGMQTGSDIVYWNGITLVDAIHNGIGQAPSADPTNNWIQISNTDNTPTNGMRTIIYSRAFDTGDANDYTFNYADNTIDLAWARMGSATFGLAYHGATNRGVLLNTPLTVLGVEDFSLNATQIFPNPSNGIFKVITKTFLNKINVYSQTGAFIKTIDVNSKDNQNEVNVVGLTTGIYLLELQNETEKSWKKVIIE